MWMKSAYPVDLQTRFFSTLLLALKIYRDIINAFAI
jgi:hypothetical protein